MERKTKVLIEKAIKGDKKSCERLIELKQKDILYIAHYHSNIQIGEDCAQEAVYQILRDIRTLRNPEYFDAWMYSIIRNVCVSTIKKLKKNIISIENDSAVNALQEEQMEFLPLEYVEDQEKRAIVIDAIHTLPSNYQDSLLLFYYQRKNYKEIAGMLEVNERKVANDLARARGLVKKRLEDKIGRELVLSAAPVTALPMLTRLFEAEAQAVFRPEAGQSLVLSARQAEAQANIKPPRVKRIGIVSGVASTAVVAVTAVVLSNPQKGPQAEALQMNPPQVVEAIKKDEPLIEEEAVSGIETLEDMIGEPHANELYQMVTGMTTQEAWQSFLEQIGAVEDSEMDSMKGFTYCVHILDKQDKRLILLSKTQDDSGRSEVQYQFGSIEMEIPQDLDIAFLFDPS